MYPSLMNDELSDWERQRQEAEQLAALLPDEAPYAPPMQLRQPVEMAPASFDAEPDWTDALGAGTTALAGLADLALNDGKGFGQIISAGGAYGAARGEQRVRQQQAALDYEAKRAALAQKNRYDDYLYASMGQRGQNQATAHADRARSQDQRDHDLARKDTTEARQAENQDPSEFIAWAADRGYNLHGLETMSQVRSAMGPLAKQWDLEHAAEKSGAQTAGKIGAELDFEPQTTAAAASRAGAVAQAQTPEAIKRIGAKATAEREAAGQKTIGNTEIIDQNVYSSLAPKQVNDANDIARSKVQFEQAMNDMAALQGNEGMQVLPSGSKASYEAAQGAAIGSLTKLFETGVINEQEYKRYVERIPPPGLSTGGVMGAVTGQNVVGDQIAGTRDELSKIFDAGLSQYGLRGKRTEGRASSAPAGDDLPTNLGVTAPRGVRNTPDFPGGAVRAGNGVRQAAGKSPMSGGVMNGPAMGESVIMQSPSGNTGPVPPEKVAAAIAAGWRRLQ